MPEFESSHQYASDEFFKLDPQKLPPHRRIHEASARTLRRLDVLRHQLTEPEESSRGLRGKTMRLLSGIVVLQHEVRRGKSMADQYTAVEIEIRSVEESNLLQEPTADVAATGIQDEKPKLTQRHQKIAYVLRSLRLPRRPSDTLLADERTNGVVILPRTGEMPRDQQVDFSIGERPVFGDKVLLGRVVEIGAIYSVGQVEEWPVYRPGANGPDRAA